MPERLQNYYIVKEHPVRIISKCKRHSKGTLLSFLLGICMIYVLTSWIPEVLSIFFPVTNVDVMSRMGGADPHLLNMMPRTYMVVYFYSILFSGVFKLSESLYALTYIRNRKVEYRAITEAFSFYTKALAIFLLQMFIVAFWTMLFVIPGIMAALNFSQAFYILADDPSKSVTQVLSESKMMMVGNRMNYVRLILYYLPYILIAYTPSLVVANYTMNVQIAGAALTLIGMVCEIPVFLANGYVCLGRTVFYELLLNESFAHFRYAGQEAFRESETK